VIPTIIASDEGCHNCSNLQHPPLPVFVACVNASELPPQMLKPGNQLQTVKIQDIVHLICKGLQGMPEAEQCLSRDIARNQIKPSDPACSESGQTVCGWVSPSRPASDCRDPPCFNPSAVSGWGQTPMPLMGWWRETAWGDEQTFTAGSQDSSMACQWFHWQHLSAASHRMDCVRVGPQTTEHPSDGALTLLQFFEPCRLP
jgi:hypothetical protein